MELGISSLAYINDLRFNGKYDDPSKMLMDGSKNCLEFAEENDIKICELLIDPPSIINEKNHQSLVELCALFQTIKKQVHGPYSDVNLASHNYWNRKASIECYFEVGKLCTEINSTIYTIHPGSSKYMFNNNRIINRKYLLESANELLDKLSPLPLTTCIENMQNKTGILLDLQEIEDFFKNVNREDIFFTWDTSHSWTCNVNVRDLWKKIDKKIKNIHVVDNTEKTSDGHPALGSGKIDFDEIFDVVNSYNYDGAIIIEIGKVEDMNQSIEYISKYF